MADALGVPYELVTIRTTGDEGRGTADKSRFVKEIEDALLREEVDLAVHSAKDVPGELPGGLVIAGVPARADARDRLIGALPAGARVGTASLRRRAQLLASRTDLVVEDLRGNVDTRLARLDAGDFDAIVLAAAGLERLGRDDGEPLPEDRFVPAPGQGCLALEARAGDDEAIALARAVTDEDALACLTAERAVVTALDATCHTAVGAHARPEGGAWKLTAWAGAPDGSAWVRDVMVGADPAALGAEVAERMLAAGAAEVLAAAPRA